MNISQKFTAKMIGAANSPVKWQKKWLDCEIKTASPNSMASQDKSKAWFRRANNRQLARADIEMG
jgi:hypothetical protein